ncbi:hypothetical protein ACNKHO_10225 [Shigella flexneri]
MHAHGALKGLAASLMKIANDVRWLASTALRVSVNCGCPENEQDRQSSGQSEPNRGEAMTMLCCR